MTSKEFRIVIALGTAAFLFLFALIAFDVNIDLTPDPAQAATYTLRPMTTYTDTVPGLLSYQGTLADANGDPIDGNVEMTFRVYTTTLGGTPLYTETHPAVVVRDGDFAVLLGQTTPFPDGLFAEPNRYLGLQVGAQAEMAPRQRFASVAFAMEAYNGVPPGTVIQYYPPLGDGDPCPEGYVLADGNNSTPDLSGLFLRASSITLTVGTADPSPTHTHYVQGWTEPEDKGAENQLESGNQEDAAQEEHKHYFSHESDNNTQIALPPYYVVRSY